ncbi:MAG: hypothetical protein RPU61_10095, partial [Candidatus Sedimenticola sp. (ex Thyasira tokunagai)]
DVDHNPYFSMKQNTHILFQITQKKPQTRGGLGENRRTVGFFETLLLILIHTIIFILTLNVM